jgi:hypothetical protein
VNSTVPVVKPCQSTFVWPLERSESLSRYLGSATPAEMILGAIASPLANQCLVMPGSFNSVARGGNGPNAISYAKHYSADMML